MGKYFKVIGVAFGLLVLSIFIPSETVSSCLCNLVFYVTPLVLLAMLMRHTPSWVKWMVVSVCVVMPFYVYFFEELRLHWKYHIWISSVGYPTDWEPDMQRKWWKDFLWSVFWRGTFYSMLFLALFKLGRRMYLKWKTGFYYFDDHK